MTAPRSKEGREARIAYIVSAYQLPELLVRLVERLDAPGTSTFIHVDARTPESTHRAMREPLAVRSRVRFLDRHPCQWGDFGHVRATLKGLDALIASGRPFHYVVLLTGQDYPLQSNRDIARVLGGAEGRVFLDAWPLPTEHWTGGGTPRYSHRHIRLAGRTFAFPGDPFRHPRLRAAWARVTRLLRLHRSFPEGLRPYGGSSYWMMPAECVRYVHDWVRRNPDVVAFFRHVDVPDEMFFHTIVMNSPFGERLAPSPLRYIDWERGGPHPGVLTARDLPELLASDALFARKFDPTVDASILDHLDEAVGGR